MKKELFYRALKEYGAYNAFISSVNRMNKIQPGKWEEVNMLINGMNNVSSILMVSFPWIRTIQGTHYWDNIFQKARKKDLGEEE